jgi:hypothetical protein
MSSESVCQVARRWVEVGSFHTRLVVRMCNSNGSLAIVIRQKDKGNLLIAAIMLFQLTQRHCLWSQIVPRPITGDYS